MGDEQAHQRDGQPDRVEHEEQRVLTPEVGALPVSPRPVAVPEVRHERRQCHRQRLGRERLVVQRTLATRVPQQVERADVDDVADPPDHAELHQLVREAVDPGEEGTQGGLSFDVAVRPDSSRKRIRPTPLGWPTVTIHAESAVGGPTVGVVGGGQLARMMQQAAIGLCVPIRLLAGAADESAAQVVSATVLGDYRDLSTLQGFAQGCDVLTFDHEHVPTGHLRALLDAGVTCRPGPDALVHAQDKAVMRQRLTALGIACPRFALVGSPRELAAFAESVGGWPVVLKAPRGGYDGKGVSLVESATQADRAFDGSATSLLAEERVAFRRELSAVVARSPSGQAAAYPVVESVQVDGVCREVVAPAPDLPGSLAVEGQRIALRIAGELAVTGVLAVELFETRDGRLLVNELAMRPHNSGHWSIDGAVTSQFENHLRAVLDLPLGSPERRARWSVMVNILGGAAGSLYDGHPHVFARDPWLKVHLYGKPVRPGRKVGHVTAYGDDLAEVRERARHAAGWYSGDSGETGGISEPGEEEER